MDTVISVDSSDTRRRTGSRLQQCASTVDSGNTWKSRVLIRVEGKQGRGESKGEMGKAGGEARKERKRDNEA